MLKAICSKIELTHSVFYCCIDDIIDYPELKANRNYDYCLKNPSWKTVFQKG
ncbi:MAG: hypothetical protein K2I00_09350 [Ruminococcus sp.]|nr:hypothetical protein [Ruminococcus sp.]